MFVGTTSFHTAPVCKKNDPAGYLQSCLSTQLLACHPSRPLYAILGLLAAIARVLPAGNDVFQ